MHLSENSHQRLETFFRWYLKNERFELPKVQFYTGRLAAHFTRLISVHGITIGKNVLITPKLISFNQKNQKKLPEDLIVHEIMHVIQYSEKGLVKFLFQYLKSYWKNLRKSGAWNADARHEAYLEIPFEIEAREAAKEYLKWKARQNGVV